jgi:hypothetical protein
MQTAAPSTPPRALSLDALRGVRITAIVTLLTMFFTKIKWFRRT